MGADPSNRPHKGLVPRSETDERPMTETEFQVQTDGSTDGSDTAAFQAAIDACSKTGGGTVVVPSGEYEVGALDLRSDVMVRVVSGATVYAAREGAAYRRDDGPDGVFIHADGVENVALVGRGTFDGRGTEFHRMGEPLIQHDGESEAHPLVSNAPHEARQGESYLNPDGPTDQWPVAKPDFRPGPMFRFDDCRNVLVRDLTLRDMPMWTLSLHGVENADVTNVDVLNHKYIPNCDGVSVMNSRNVHLSDCTIRSCDDSIVLGGYRDGGPTDGVTVSNCVLSSNACAIKFGSETEADVRNCLFQNCVVRSSNRGLGIQHRDEGDIENVLFSDIVVETRLLPGPWWGKSEPIYVTSIPRDESTELGAVRNVRFSNVVARGENGALVYGHEGATLSDVRLSEVRFEIRGSDHADAVGGNFDLQPTAVTAPIVAHDVPGVHCEGLSGVELADVTVEWIGDRLPAYFSHGLQCVDVDGVTVDGFTGRGATEGAAAIRLARTRRATVRNCTAAPGTETFLVAEESVDPRLFAANDLTDAETGVAGDVAGFEAVGNRPPATDGDGR